MALNSYANLKASVADWLARSDLTSQIDDFIDLFEAEFNRRMKLVDMRSSTTITTSSTTYLYDLPTDFSKMVNISFNDDPQDIEFISTKIQKIITSGEASRTGRPTTVSLAAPSSSGAPLRLAFGEKPDGVYTLNVDYYAKLPALNSTNTTNWLLEQQPGAYLYGTLKQAGLFIKDTETRQEIEQEYNRLLVDMQMDSESKKAGGQGFRVLTTVRNP